MVEDTNSYNRSKRRHTRRHDALPVYRRTGSIHIIWILTPVIIYSDTGISVELRILLIIADPDDRTVIGRLGVCCTKITDAKVIKESLIHPVYTHKTILFIVIDVGRKSVSEHILAVTAFSALTTEQPVIPIVAASAILPIAVTIFPVFLAIHLDFLFPETASVRSLRNNHIRDISHRCPYPC